MTDNQDKRFLHTMEKILIELKNKYGKEDFKSLEKAIIERAKKDSKDLSLQSQVEFISLIKNVLEAYEFAAKKHKKQKRSSGEPYIVHPLYVALQEIYHQQHETGTYNESPIIAALLHDTVEDTDTSFSDINSKFGSRMTKIVNNLTKVPEWSEWKDEGFLDYDEKAALQFVRANRDKASLDVKYADRYHNLQTLRYMKPESQIRKILETLSAGFIGEAEENKYFDFLLELYIVIQRYLTDENIEKYAHDPVNAKRARDTAVVQIKKILKRNHKNMFPVREEE